MLPDRSPEWRNNRLKKNWNEGLKWLKAINTVDRHALLLYTEKLEMTINSDRRQLLQSSKIYMLSPLLSSAPQYMGYIAFAHSFSTLLALHVVL